MTGSAAPQYAESEVAGGGSPQETQSTASGYVGDGTDYIEIVSATRHHVVKAAPKPVPTKPKTTITASKPTIFSASNIASQLSPASFGYSVPKEANIDDDIEVTVKLNPSLNTSEIETRLPDGQKITQTIQVSKIVQIKVESRDFDIHPITPERQGIDDRQDTTWKWSLKPLTSGPNKSVKITVTAIVTVDGDRVERYIDTYVGTVKVDITAKQRLFKWLSANWEWAWGSLLIPVAGIAWSRYSKKNKKKKK